MSAAVAENRVDADAMAVLLRLGVYPVCSVTLADELLFDAQRFADALHAIRESGVTLITCDQMTIRIDRDSWGEVCRRTQRFVQ